MQIFRFEISSPRQAPLIVDERLLSNRRGIWCHVELIALRYRERSGTLITVRNTDGEIVARAGIASALASIDECHCLLCPVKNNPKEYISKESRELTVLFSFLDQVDGGAILISRVGEIIRMNRNAEAMLGDGLMVKGKRLFATLPQSQVILNRLLQAVCDQRGKSIEALALPRSNGKQPLILQTVPLCEMVPPIFFAGETDCALVLLSDLEEPDASSVATVLGALGLTRAESRVAAFIGAGLSPKEISIKLGVTVDTVRTHLKSIKSKFGIHRQAEIIKLVTRLRLMKPPLLQTSSNGPTTILHNF
jgi:DNA-binding CsgD family transcriptional regulator